MKFVYSLVDSVLRIGLGSKIVLSTKHAYKSYLLFINKDKFKPLFT